MRRSALVAIALAGFGCRGAEGPAVAEDPVDWSVSVAVDERTIQVGEDLVLALTLRHPRGGDFVAPPESSFEPFSVIELRREEISAVETRLFVRLGAYFLPAEVEVPALEIRTRTEGGRSETLRTEPLEVSVVTSLTPEVTDIHDIKDPVALELRRSWSLLWWLLAALLAALLAFYLYRRFRKEPDGSAPSWSPPLPPADEEALDALRRLREKKLVERGSFRAFHDELSEIVKRYAGRRFEVPYLERTTAEILEDLSAAPMGEEPRAALRSILVACDLVKFARLVPPAEEAYRTWSVAERLVVETRAAPAVEPEMAEAGA